MDIDTSIENVIQAVKEHKGCEAEKKKLKKEAQIVLGTCKKLKDMLAKETAENNNTVQTMQNELKTVVNVHQVEKEKSVIRIVDIERKLASLRLENKTLKEQILVLQPKSDLRLNEEKPIKVLSEQKFNDDNEKKFKSLQDELQSTKVELKSEQDKCKRLDDENKCLKNQVERLETKFEEYKMSHV